LAFLKTLEEITSGVAEGFAARQGGLKYVSTASTNSLTWGIAE
jgi:hypothetical protein